MHFIIIIHISNIRYYIPMLGQIQKVEWKGKYQVQRSEFITTMMITLITLHLVIGWV